MCDKDGNIAGEYNVEYGLGYEGMNLVWHGKDEGKPIIWTNNQGSNFVIDGENANWWID